METTTNNSPTCAESLSASATETFASDINKGLSSLEKRLDSKYFYNDQGSLLFQEIMELPEYYLTRAEEEIFLTQKELIVEYFTKDASYIDIAELGAGDGAKTIILLNHLKEQRYEFSYNAIDISAKALQELAGSIHASFPEIDMRLIQNDYLQGLAQVSNKGNARKVLLFLGSNIGNFSHEQSNEFLRRIRETLQKGDRLMIGFDLKKSPEIILKAYNDSQGVTAAFNLNLLQRINEELGGNFDLNFFHHIPVYDAEKGEARSYLKSLVDQEVWIEKLNTTFKFSKDELVHTEISRKYGVDEIEHMAKRSGFQVIKPLFDSKKYFCDSIWEAC